MQYRILIGSIIGNYYISHYLVLEKRLKGDIL